MSGRDIFLRMSDGEAYRLTPEIPCSCGHDAYFQHVEGSANLRGKVVSVEAVENQHVDSKHDLRTDRDVIEGWAYKIAVEGKGHCMIEIRQEDNGCYQGHLEFERVNAVAGEPLSDF